ncbi:MAG: HEAT repeat domain-containing protein [Planctomycetes bacterium]|nr:HEAT repeat domain-containing protein [Planctomycetota bacterium]
MSKTRMHLVMIVALLLTSAVPMVAQTVASQGDEAKLIAVLKSSEASRQDKIAACRQLAIMGGKDSIAPLAALLGSEDLSHNARYALEPNPDPAVDAAFRSALGKVRGLPLVGVIGSIGVRRDAQAVGALTKFLSDSDVVVAQAAARAMGKIGTTEAAQALQAALPQAPAAAKLDFCEGLFRCAEALAAADQKEQAVAIYDELLKLDAAHQVRGGALRGAILTRARGGPKLLRQYLRSDDYILFSAAVQASRDLPGDRVTKALANEMGNLPADNQVLIIQALGCRGDKAAVPALLDAARTGPTPVRVAALQAVTELGDAAAVPVFVQLLDDSTAEIAQAAQASLATMPGREADGAVMQMFQSGEPDKQRLALDLMSRRRIKDSMPALQQAARSADARTRQEAMKMIGDLGGADQLPTLLELLDGAQSPQDLTAAEQAITAACTKAKDPLAQAEKLAGRLSQVKPAQQTALLRVVAAIGGPNSLKTVRALVDSSNAEVRSAAIRALGSWRTADAAPDLLALARKTSDSAEKTLFVRSYLDLAARGDMTLEQRLDMCQQAGSLVQRINEKRQLLGILGKIDSPEAMNVILPYLRDAEVQQEAGIAAVTIAERLMRGRGPWPYAAELVEPLEKVIQATTNDQIAKRARTLLQQAKEGRRKK